jgi:hypothetical protein
MHRKHAFIVDIDQLLDLESDLVEGFRGVLPPAPKALVSVVGPGDRKLSDVVEPNLGVAQLQRQFPARESFRPPTNQLDVLLRHRLLPQPGGFEGLFFGQEVAPPDALSLPDACGQPGRRLKGRGGLRTMAAITRSSP